MQKNHTQVPSVASTGLNLVQIRKGEPMVSSITMSEVFERSHDQLLRSIRRVLVKRPLDHLVETSIDQQGKDRPVFWFNERSALIITPYIGGYKSIDGQERLVDAYLAYHRQKEVRKESDWQKVRADSICSFTMQNATLKDMRETHGKTTEAKHYMCEAKLIGYVMTGKFGGLDRNRLTAGDLQRIADFQRYNAMLIAQDIPYQQRKAMLMDRAVKKLAA